MEISLVFVNKEFGKIRVAEHNGAAWFVGSDVPVEAQSADQIVFSGWPAVSIEHDDLRAFRGDFDETATFHAPQTTVRELYSRMSISTSIYTTRTSTFRQFQP